MEHLRRLELVPYGGYSNTAVVWTWFTVSNAFYFPNTTATTQIQITASGYSSTVQLYKFYVIVYDSTYTTYYQSIGYFFFNHTYVHTQLTQHITIQNNHWGGDTIGYKHVYVQCVTTPGGGTYLISDVNDTLQFSISVIG